MDAPHCVIREGATVRAVSYADTSETARRGFYRSRQQTLMATTIATRRPSSLAISPTAFYKNGNSPASQTTSRRNCGDFIGHALPREFASSHREINSDLQDIFRGFFGSKAYADLAGARILGREVPLLMPWDGRIMEGVIDVIYERDGLLYLADYKTDRISRRDLAEGAAHYHRQAEIYSRAAAQGLQREVAAFKLIFLRLGEAVEVQLSQKQGEPLP